MIFNFIVHALLAMVQAIFSILPNVAATPQAIIDGSQWIIDTIHNVISIIAMFLSPELLSACVVVAVGVYNWEWIYHTVMWIVKKIPMINIK